MASCTFNIKNIAEINKLPKKAFDTLNDIAISTVRGLMFSSFRGTFLHNAILPIVDSTLITAQNI